MKFFDINLNLRKRKNYFDLNIHRQCDAKLNIFNKILFFLNLYLNTFGLAIGKIELIKYQGEIKIEYEDSDLTCKKRQEAYNLFRKHFKVRERSTLSQDELSYYHNSAKETSTMSDLNYAKFRKHVALHQEKESRLQSINKIKQIRSIMNRYFEIHQNLYGWFNEPFEKIAFVIRNTKFRLPLDKNFNFKIHLSGDGLNLTRTKFNLVNFCFKLINETHPAGKTEYKYKNELKHKKIKQNDIHTLGNFKNL